MKTQFDSSNVPRAMTPAPEPRTRRYFQTYSGIRLPLRLVGPIDETELTHRNTFIRADFDALDRLSACEKVVYGHVELAHHYSYYESGALERAVITSGEDEAVLEFDEAGMRRTGDPS